MRDFRLKLMVSGYRAYFQILALLSDERAANAALDRFSRPKSRKRRSLQLPIFKEAEWAHLQTPTGKLAHYYWAGSGHKSVLLAHGWESDAGTFSPMIEHMLSKGYSVRALDAPAHGMSDGKKAEPGGVRPGHSFVGSCHWRCEFMRRTFIWRDGNGPGLQF